jgi:tryptophan synthase alpha chain
LVFGVGISTPQAAATACEVGDGVIVGTALVRRALASADTGGSFDEITAFVGELAEAVRA